MPISRNQMYSSPLEYLEETHETGLCSGNQCRSCLFYKLLGFLLGNLYRLEPYPVSIDMRWQCAVDFHSQCLLHIITDPPNVLLTENSNKNCRLRPNVIPRFNVAIANIGSEHDE